MKIQEVADLTGTTVRTLRYYDEIGLLPPSRITPAGYRLYDEASLETLQQILFFRELDFPLENIRRIMDDPHYDRKQALAHQKELLCQKRDRLNGLIDLLERRIKGETTMSFEEFDMSQIEAHKQKYAQETQERWGGTDAYKESARKSARYGKDDWQRIGVESEAIMQGFAALRGQDPTCSEAQALCARWQQHISRNFYNCTKEILAGLGQMYVLDERFTQNLDQYGEGTAAFMAQALAAYCAE